MSEHTIEIMLPRTVITCYDEKKEQVEPLTVVGKLTKTECSNFLKENFTDVLYIKHEHTFEPYNIRGKDLEQLLIDNSI